MDTKTKKQLKLHIIEIKKETKLYISEIKKELKKTGKTKVSLFKKLDKMNNNLKELDEFYKVITK